MLDGESSEGEAGEQIWLWRSDKSEKDEDMVDEMSQVEYMLPLSKP